MRLKYKLTRSIIIILIFIPTHLRSGNNQRNSNTTTVDSSKTAPLPWTVQPASLWLKDFTNSPRDTGIAMPQSDLINEKIGTKTRVYQLFDRWDLIDQIRNDRGSQYTEVTAECKGNIELDFALSPEEWAQPINRWRYYRAVDALITKIGNQLLADFGNPFADHEQEFFLQALKTLAWQESKWQHYLRYKDWFFVIVSGGSYNKLDDWGITQIARSSFDADFLLNKKFFDCNGYCSISSSLYYGFMEYYFCYLEAREHPENNRNLFHKIMGAYNLYCSGYSASHRGFSVDEGYRSYQIRALSGYKENFESQPWLDLLDRNYYLNYVLDHGAIIRGDTTQKKLALIFTGGDYADGGNHIQSVLKKMNVKAGFFFTGDFYRNVKHKKLIQQLKMDGHYLGPHSDKHLLYCAWEDRDSTLVSKQQFTNDILANYKAMESFGITQEDASLYIPPYEWHNDTIASWCNDLNLTLINFTPGTSSNADYTIPGMSAYRSSDSIFNKIMQYEQNDIHRLNGFILLMHIGTHPERTDKFYYRLEELIKRLREKGYSFPRIDEMLK